MFEFLIEFLINVLCGLGRISPQCDSPKNYLIYYGTILVIIIILALAALAVFFDYHNATSVD